MREILDVPLFSGHWGERGKPRLIRTTKAIAEGAIAEEEDQYGEAAAVPVARKKWNVEEIRIQRKKREFAAEWSFATPALFDPLFSGALRPEKRRSKPFASRSSRVQIIKFHDENEENVLFLK